MDRMDSKTGHTLVSWQKFLPPGAAAEPISCLRLRKSRNGMPIVPISNAGDVSQADHRRPSVISTMPMDDKFAHGLPAAEGGQTRHLLSGVCYHESPGTIREGSLDGGLELRSRLFPLREGPTRAVGSRLDTA